MNLPTYNVELKSEEPYSFEFFSEGKNGKIQKLIIYKEIEEKFFNLAFGDKDLKTGKLNDKSISDNGDTEKILATVVLTIYLFTKRNPYAYVFASGSTPARNRLYRRSITKYLAQAQEDFKIYGMLFDEKTEVFTPNKDYKAFIIQRKI